MQTEYLEPDDLVIDPEDGEIRRIANIHSNGDVFMQDGGVMGADEIDRVYTQDEIDTLLSGGYDKVPTHLPVASFAADTCKSCNGDGLEHPNGDVPEIVNDEPCSECQGFDS